MKTLVLYLLLYFVQSFVSKCSTENIIRYKRPKTIKEVFYDFFIISFIVSYRFKGHFQYRLYRGSVQIFLITVQNDKGLLSTSAGVWFPLYGLSDSKFSRHFFFRPPHASRLPRCNVGQASRRSPSCSGHRFESCRGFRELQMFTMSLHLFFHFSSCRSFHRLMPKSILREWKFCR